MYTKENYLSLSRGLGKSLTPDEDRAELEKMRVVLGIPNKPRNMDGWASRTTQAQRAKTLFLLFSKRVDTSQPIN